MSNINTIMCTFFGGGEGGGGKGEEIRNRPPNSPKRAIPLAPICNIYLYNIIYWRFVQVPSFKSVGTWIKISFFFLISLLKNTKVSIKKKLHDPLKDMNEDISTCTLAVLLFYSASFFYKWWYEDCIHLIENHVSQLKLGGLTLFVSN